MDRDQLLKSAKAVKKVNNDVAKEYFQKSEQLISKMNKVMLARPDIEGLIGKDNLDMMKDNHANHVRFMSSLLKDYNPEVFVDTVLWVFRAYRTHNFTTNYWAAQLNAWIEVLRGVMNLDSYNAIYPYYEWMQTNIPAFVKLSDEKIDAPNSMH